MELSSGDQGRVPGLMEASTGLGRLLELWLERPSGLMLGPSEAPSAPAGVESCRSRWLVLRRLVLRRGGGGLGR